VINNEDPALALRLTLATKQVNRLASDRVGLTLELNESA
jgi:hypothetical protein